MADLLTEEKLSDLSDNLATGDNVPKLGLKLGLVKSKVDMYMKINKKNDNSEGTSKMLFYWKGKTPTAKQIPDLVKALIESDLVAFAEDCFPVEAKRQLQGQMESPSSSTSNVTSPCSLDRIVTDKELMNLAGCLPSDYYMPVAINLQLQYTEYDNIRRQNTSSLTDANFQMLRKWKCKQNCGKVKDLDKALNEADCGALPYKENV